MKEKFAYYFDENGEREMDLFQVLKIERDFFDKYDEAEFKSISSKLLRQFHPDKNEETDSEISKKCFQKIYHAYETLKDPEKRKQYLLGENDFVSYFNPHFDFKQAYEELAQGFKEKINQLVRLEERIQHLGDSEKENNDTLEKIIEELGTISVRSMFDTKEANEALAKFNEVKNLAVSKAKTPEELYAAHILLKNDARGNIFVDYSLAQKSASAGYLPALSEMLGGIFTNKFTPGEEAIKWGLLYINHLETILIPEAQNQESLEVIKKSLAKLRNAYGEILPKNIPLEQKALENLITEIINFSEMKNWVSIKPTKFELSLEMFKPIDSQPNSPVPSENYEEKGKAKESERPGNNNKSTLNEVNSYETPKDQFLKEHGKLWEKSKNGIFGFFRQTNLDKDQEFSEIIRYAKNNNNRSRQACINLGWMKKDGTLNEDNPNLPEEVSDAYRSIKNTPGK